MNDKDRQERATHQEEARDVAQDAAEERAVEEMQAADEVSSPEEELERLRAENAELKDKYLRALSDMESLRRRLMKEKEEAVKYAAADFARDMLNVCDNLTRAIESVPEEQKGQHELLDRLLEGVEMTLKDMLATFERHHIRKIPSQGEKFNPNVHEAMFEVEAGPEEAGKVVQVIQEGYTHHDRVLRPARVGVAKNSSGGEGEKKG